MTEATPDTKWLRRDSEVIVKSGKPHFNSTEIVQAQAILSLLDYIEELEASLKQSDDAYAWDMLLPEEPSQARQE